MRYNFQLAKSIKQLKLILNLRTFTNEITFTENF
jgi:hypothetical protein